MRHPLDPIVLRGYRRRATDLPDVEELRALARLAYWQGFWGAFGNPPFQRMMSRRRETASWAALRHYTDAR